jgi:hypothetical protein
MTPPLQARARVDRYAPFSYTGARCCCQIAAGQRTRCGTASDRLPKSAREGGKNVATDQKGEERLPSCHACSSPTISGYSKLIPIFRACATYDHSASRNPSKMIAFWSDLWPLAACQ